jgi:2-succinyl-6-hydroxy-2,4-cyclohexadiene-1-carboxylate synthase
VAESEHVAAGASGAERSGGGVGRLSASPENLVLLHGFGGTARAWDLVVGHLPQERYRPLALDLPGHGALADAPWPISFEGCVTSVLERAPERFVLAGYSMGGRVALHAALAAPERVLGLVLLGATAGIEDEHERSLRRESDGLLADELENGSFELFIERWRAQPLFEGEPAEVSELARADQRRNRPEALAAVLRGIGTGEMAPLWDRLGELEMPVSVLVGDRDVKFQRAGRRMAELAPNARLRVVAGAHHLPLENPAAVAAAILDAAR